MKAVSRLLRLFALFASFAAMCAATPAITEFMASNRTTLTDEDGAFSDWIEIYNPATAAVDLAGWYLTDNAAQKTKWQFPAVQIPAGGYLIVFASDKDRRTPGAPLHTNFALSADGEYLALVSADGTTVVSEFAPTYPAQTADTAYGVSSSGFMGALETPTPGGANTAAKTITLSLANNSGTSEAFATTMPVIVLDNAAAGTQTQADGEKEGTISLYSAGDTLTSAAGLKVRGSSSADFPKQSYSIELHDATGSSSKASLLGMAKVADWALVSPWTYDPSYLRNAYAYALSNRLGLWAPQTRFTEVFFQGDGTALSSNHYLGLGVLTERIKIASDLVDLQSLAPTDISGDAVTGGYILKIDPKDDDEFGWTTDHGIPSTTDGATSLVVVSPKAAKLADEQRDYIQGYVQAFENALYADRAGNWATRDYLGYIDRASWIDFHLLQVLTKNPDGLVRSTYFTKDRGGKLKAGPVWDFDRAMGSVDPRSQAWNEWNEATAGAKLWETGWWGLMAKDPDFMQAWIDRWQALRRNELSDERLTALATSLAAQIDPAAAARDATRWSENASRYGTYQGEVDQLISWLRNRSNWIDGQFIAAPVSISTGRAVQIFAPGGMQIAYTLDGTDPRASGGVIASNALVVATSLTLPPGATATVRLYNPSVATDSVGSAWSSPVVVNVNDMIDSAAGSGNDASSPQLMAMSTRAELTGAGATFTSGLVVSGTEAKTFVIRAVGRTLATFGVVDALPDPVLKVTSSDGTIIASSPGAQSNNIEDDLSLLAPQFAAVGAFPLTETGTGRDAAVVVTLTPGRYAVTVSSESGASGVVLAEIYAAGEASAVKFVSAQNTLTAGGSYISGISIGGTTSREVLIRAIGGNSDATLALFAGPELLSANDDWSYATNASELASAAMQAGVSPLAAGGRDAALLLRLNPGTYTVQVGANFSAPAGVLLEVVELP